MKNVFPSKITIDNIDSDLVTSDKFIEVLTLACSSLQTSNLTISVSPVSIDISYLKQNFISLNNHPYFSSPQQVTVCELDISTLNDVLLFTPHPDDEVLGAAVLLSRLAKAEKQVHVAYLTTVTDPENNIRVKEAEKGLNVMGLSAENMLLYDLPHRSMLKREVTDVDVEYVVDILNDRKPKVVFVPADLYDPSRTHQKCYEILMKALKREEFASVEIFFYYSVWYKPKKNEFSHVLSYDFQDYAMKCNSMFAHASQYENKFMGEDSRPFYYRAMQRDQEFGSEGTGQFCEIFYKAK